MEMQTVKFYQTGTHTIGNRLLAPEDRTVQSDATRTRRKQIAEEQLAHAALQACAPDGGQRGQRLHQRLRRAARLGGDHEAGFGQIE